MGHYLSEMTGEPFESSENLKYNEERVLAMIAKYDKNPTNIVVTKKWITSDPKRNWANIEYTAKGRRCFFNKNVKDVI